MKYYHVHSELFNNRFKGEDGFGKRNPSVSIRHLKDRATYLDFKEKIISKKELIKSNHVLDFVNCEERTGDYVEDYDWILLDAYALRYESEYSPISVNGWLISPKLKELLIKSVIVLGKEHIFHSAKLRFQGEFLDYYLCQFVNHDNEIVDLDKCRLISLPDGIDESDPLDFNSYVDLTWLIRWYDNAVDFKFGLHFKEYQDVFKSSLLKGTYASEKFKKLVEVNGITGFEFEPAPQLEISFPIKA